MGTAAAAERPEGSGFVAWLAHHEWVIYVAMTVELIAYLINGVRQMINAPASLAWTICLSLCLAFGLTASLLTFSIGRHFERLCSGCIAAMPLNGSELAEKRMWALRVYHASPAMREWIQRKLNIGLNAAVFVMMGIQFVILMALFFLVSWALHAPSLAVSVLIVSSIFLGVASMRHRPLIPWCKWCQNGKGRGPREHVCDPPPLPTNSPDPVKAS